MGFKNVYEDARRADAYAGLEFPGTYYLAYRDLPDIINKHVKGKKAIDFGCGTGRSTRFLRKLGFETKGIDISKPMVGQARKIDPEGDYRIVDDGDLSQFEMNSCDLILSVFTFDNIPNLKKKMVLFKEMARVLKNNGRIINLVSSPLIYLNEWVSFTTKDFPENKSAKSGDRVRIIMKDVEDRRPVEDIIFSDEDYRKVYKKAGLEILDIHRPLARENEPYEWINETKISPWVIYVMKKMQL